MKMRDTLYPRICKINDSTNLVEVAYDPIDNEMMATFKGNVRYIYKNIPGNIFGLIVCAESAGSTFNITMKSKNIVGVKVDE